MLLDDVQTEVKNQLDEQSNLGVDVTRVGGVPEKGPVNRGVWYQVLNVTAVFADLKGSTGLNAEEEPDNAAHAYTYFIRAMTIILDRFGAKYVDIHGDGIFGLFSTEHSRYSAAACAITMRTELERTIAPQFEDSTWVDWDLKAGIGIDCGTLLVRRLGLRGTKQNEVWAGKPVNIAAKLSSLAEPNSVAVSDRVFNQYKSASELRQRALLWSCGCNGDNGQGRGLEADEDEMVDLWDENAVLEGRGLDFDTYHSLKSKWCSIHGAEFCEAIVTGCLP